MYIIGNGKLITLSKSVPYHSSGAVVSDGSIILDVGQTEQMLERYPNAEFIDANGAVIAPGFVDMHTHSRNTVFCGRAMPRFCASDRYRMLSSCLFLPETHMDHADDVDLAYAFAVRAIKNGITTVFEHHSLPKQPSGCLYSLASVFRECGLRAGICYAVSDRFGVRKANAFIKENAEFIELCNALDLPTIKPMFGIRSMLDISDAALEECVKANSGKNGIHIHIGETPDDHLFSIRKFGTSPARRLLEANAVTHDSLVVCGPFIERSDLAMLLESNCALTVSPMMAALLGGAYSSDFERAAIAGKLHIATDSLCGSLLDAARAAVLQFGLDGENSSNILLPAANMLFRANPAAASRIFAAKLGVLEPGAAADIIVLKPGFAPTFDSEEELLCSLIATGAVCELTMANGRILMRDGKLCELDEKAIASKLSSVASKLLAR